jgi:hypothetical protein
LFASFCGTTPEGAFAGVMVHVREGILSELEAYALSDAKKFSFPRSEALKSFGPDEKA